MKTIDLQLNSIIPSVILILLLATMGKANAQYYYNYEPALGEYSEEGSTSDNVEMNFNYSNCSFSSTTNYYWIGHVNTCLYSHNTSSGLMRFRIAKCDNNYYFGNGGSGKIIIMKNNSSVVLCETYSISDSYTHYITKSFYESNFSGTNYYDVFLITSDLVNRYYAGRVIVRRGYAPEVTTGDAYNVTFNSATISGYINPNGLTTTYYFQWSTNSSFSTSNYSDTYTYPNTGYSPNGVSLGAFAVLESGRTYYYRLRATNAAGTVTGETRSFTTLYNYVPPEVTTQDATDITPYQAVLHGWVNPQGLQTTGWFEWGSTTSMNNTTDSWTIPSDNYANLTASKQLTGLEPGQKYYFRICASNSEGTTYGTRLYFYTDAGGNPIVTTGSASLITSNTAKISGTINPQALTTSYYFRYGTTSNYELGQVGQGSLSSGITTNQNVYTNLSGLIPNTTYHYQLYATNNQGTAYGEDKTFKTEENLCYFADCTSGEVHDAATFLCERGVVTGDAGAHTLRPGDDITRAELAKATFFGLYSNSNGVNIPNPLVTDYFPCIYPDLQANSFYYQSARALLYLEYGDGVSPFDRDNSCFNPNGTITRRLVLKVLLEAFNIAPATSGSTPFTDFASTEAFWGYAKKAYDLGIVQNTTFRPTENCTRGEAFLMLSRILQKIDQNAITKPNPNYDTYNPLNSDYFVPANLSPQVANAIRGVEYGNFNYYEKDFFDIPGYMNLSFGISYNSYLTEMPSEFYPVNPMGKAWTHTYDMYMNIITDPYENKSYYVFHMPEGALLIYKAENGALAKYTEGNYYTLSSNSLSASSYTLKSTGQMSYVFTKKSDGVYYLTQIKDRSNNTITINIGSSNGKYRVSSVSTLGRTLTFGYTSDNLLSYVKDPIGRYVYFYYTNGQMTSLKDAKNQTTYFNYGTLDSEKGLLKEIQLPKGNYVYNDYQRRKLKSMSYYGVSTQTHTDISISPDYQNGSTTSKVIENLGGSQNVTTTYTMNDKNRVTRIKDNLNTDVSYQYGMDNNPDLVTNMTDNKTGLQSSYSYDASSGMMTSVTYSNGSETHTVMAAYNAYNDITEYTDANNNKTYYYYDASTHHLNRIKDAMGNTTYIDCNSYGVPTRVTNPMGMNIDYSYNSYGNLNEISIPSLNVTATLNYDGVSRTTSRTDFLGRTTNYTYDNNDNLVSITNADGKTTTYNYDANDNVTWIQNAKGVKTNFTYDSNTDFLTQVSFQGASRSYTYNRDGSLKSFTNPNGNTFNYTYNNSGELTSDGYASLQYYSSSGLLWKVTKDNKPITYTYDSFDRVQSIAYDGMTVSYTYDNNGNVLTITYPGSKTVTYTYDALNRIKTVKDWNNKTTTYNYRADGQIDYYQYPNAVRTTFNYDPSGRCNGISTKRSSGSGSVVAEYSFELDNMGNHLSESFTEPFASYPSISTETINYSYGSNNRLETAGNLSFQYDNNGNTITRTGRTYDYDNKDNLISVSGDYTATFTYDGLGNRRSATRNGTTTKYVLNLLGSMPAVLMETDANGSVLNYYIYGASGLISRIDANNNTRYYVYDSRGNTVAMTDATSSANVTHKYQYDDFGKVLQSEEADANLFRYVGRFGVMYEDEALAFMRARYYDPEIGRFLSEDPIWSTNLYLYADNNPMMRIDPQGENAAAIFTNIMGWVGTTYTFADFAAFGIDLDSQTGVNNYAMSWASVSASLVGVILGSANPVGAVATCLSAGISIGQLIGDAFDEQITNGLANLMYNIKYKKKQKKQGANLKPVQSVQSVQSVQAAAPEFKIDKEAMDFIFGSSDSYAKHLKSLFLSFREANWPQEKKLRAYEVMFRKAREYMNK